MTDERTKRILAIHNKIQKTTTELTKFYITDDINVVYVLLYGFKGDNDEFENGEYLVKINLPLPSTNGPGYPFEPPVFTFLTPNGVYDINGKVCISIGEYHKENYRAVLNYNGFCMNLISGMIGWKTLGSGIRLLKTSIEDKKKLAKQSKDYNYEHYLHIIKKIKQNTTNNKQQNANIVAKDSSIDLKNIKNERELRRLQRLAKRNNI